MSKRERKEKPRIATKEARRWEPPAGASDGAMLWSLAVWLVRNCSHIIALEDLSEEEAQIFSAHWFGQGNLKGRGGETLGELLVTWRKARWPISTSFVYLLKDVIFLEVSAKGNIALVDYLDYWEMFGKVAGLESKELISLMLMCPKNATFSRQVLEHAGDPTAVTFQDIKKVGKHIDAVAALETVLKPAAGTAPAVVAATPQEEGKEQSVEEMVEERINVALANRGFTGGRGGRGGRGNRRAGMHGGAPNKPAAAYFKDNKRVISPSCRDCGMAPHGGPCQVVRCDMECFHCHNKGHRFTVCNHPGAYNTRTPSSTRS